MTNNIPKLILHDFSPFLLNNQILYTTPSNVENSGIPLFYSISLTPLQYNNKFNFISF